MRGLQGDSARPFALENFEYGDLEMYNFNPFLLKKMLTLVTFLNAPFNSVNSFLPTPSPVFPGPKHF
jgi:hypothetical protein